ncbi:MAG: exo-beta-N-acetylmuramidase NamZ family protein [Anaerolineae bacterium]
MKVRTGLEVLCDRRDPLAGGRSGLITHPAAVLPDLTSSVDALLEAGVRLTALFGMEHGFAGSAADGVAVGHGRDARTGLPVFSLYGATREPTAEMLAGVDVLLFDVQDVGVRFYTFISTLYYILRSARQHGVSVIVLDRPNPLNGLAIEGPSVAPGYGSFVGIAPIPIRHGMTIGELARYLNAEHHLGAELTVVEMQGWRRAMWFDETGLPWVPTSPAMPHLSTAIVYPGTCFIEGTNLSEGRGTALPFEVVGAPWLDGHALAHALNQLALPGVRFRPTQFEPAASKHAGQMCQGVQIHVTDRAAFRPVEAGLHVVAACRAQAPERFTFLSTSWEGRPPHFDLLAGNATIREGLAAGVPVAELTAGWPAIAAEFEERRQPHLLYR